MEDNIILIVAILGLLMLIAGENNGKNNMRKMWARNER